MENKRGFYKNFFYYVIPAVLSFALSGVYSIVDGFFVGNAVGDIGLSAINVAVPIVMVMQCLGTGIGMGGSVWYSINNASQKADEAKKISRLYPLAFDNLKPCFNDSLSFVHGRTYISSWRGRQDSRIWNPIHQGYGLRSDFSGFCNGRCSDNPQ